METCFLKNLQNLTKHIHLQRLRQKADYNIIHENKERKIQKQAET